MSGDSLRVYATSYCRADVRDILCTVPSLPAGPNFVSPFGIVAMYSHTYRSQVHL